MFEYNITSINQRNSIPVPGLRITCVASRTYVATNFSRRSRGCYSAKNSCTMILIAALCCTRGLPSFSSACLRTYPNTRAHSISVRVKD